ncbi:MAG TPA: hypothetical protein PKE04_16135 [Clostridia bacterium]|nr:hypothetical protein [Clostridia bacterium]
MYSSRAYRPSRRGFTAHSRRTHALGAYVLLTLVAVLLITAVYTVIDNGRVIVREQTVTISNLPAALEGYTILQISDLAGVRIGPKQRAVRQALAKKTYHVVCMTGDMIGPARDPQPFYELISVLDPTKPMFFIAGDGDPSPFPEEGTYSLGILADYITGAQSHGAVYLSGTTGVTYRGQNVWFSPSENLLLNLSETETSLGNELSRAFESSQSSRTSQELEYRLEVLSKEQATRAQIQPGDLHIVLSHRPLDDSYVSILQTMASESSPFYRSIGLILAGHYAGGQWRLPFLGPIYARPQGFFPEDIDGLTVAGSYTQYISRGIGNASDTPFPRFRLFNAPEISLIRLTSAL